MEYELQPISEIHGKIEITFNTENKELDPHDTIENQIVLTIGKTGRANRLTFTDFDEKNLRQLSKTFEEIADKIEDLRPE